MIECAKGSTLDLSKADAWQKPEYKCILKCSLDKDGFLKDGALVDAVVLKSIQDEKDLDPAVKDKLLKAAPPCLDGVKSTADLCEKSFNLVACLYKTYT